MEAVTYTCNGDGNRLEKLSNGTMTKAYWYGAGTEILDEMTGDGTFSNEYVFFGGKRIAMRNVLSGVIYYYSEDMLGSSRTIVQAGQTSPCYDADFYPFGGERTITNTCSQNYKFEGKERDTESGNDDFGARYYSSRLGRWLSADWSSVPAPVPYANLTNPQTLNLYAMVSDNPETFADLDGHCIALDVSCNDGPPGVQEDAPIPQDKQKKKSNTGTNTPSSTTQQALGANANKQADDQKKQDDQKNEDKGDPDQPPPGTQPSQAGGGKGGGQQPKGERRRTGKPEGTPNPIKGARPIRDNNRKIVGWRVPTPDGKGVVKSLEWGKDHGLDPANFRTAASFAAIGGIIAYIFSTAPEWGPWVAAGLAF